jgi:hypothetical protein
MNQVSGEAAMEKSSRRREGAKTVTFEPQACLTKHWQIKDFAAPKRVFHKFLEFHHAGPDRSEDEKPDPKFPELFWKRSMDKLNPPRACLGEGDQAKPGGGALLIPNFPSPTTLRAAVPLPEQARGGISTKVPPPSANRIAAKAQMSNSR